MAYLHLLKKLKTTIHLPTKTTRAYCVDVITNGGSTTISLHLLHKFQHLTCNWPVDGLSCKISSSDTARSAFDPGTSKYIIALPTVNTLT